MSTRSQIAIELPDNTIQTVYCHQDGYPAYNGAILLRYYNSAEMARQLIDSGGISSIAEKIGSKHSFGYGEGGDRPDDECIFYHRDRGEEMEICTVASRQELVDKITEGEYTFHRGDAEYFYLFSLAGEWLVCDADNFVGGFVPLKTHPEVINSKYVEFQG